MAYRGIDVTKIIPEEFRETPYFQDLADAIQKIIVDPFINNLNELMLIRQAGDDIQTESVTVTSPAFVYQLSDPFDRGSLLVMERGINIFKESDPEGSGNTDSMINAVTGLSNGSVNHETRTLTMSFTGASPGNPINLEIVYLTQYSMDTEMIDHLRQTLGLFIDTTGLSTEEDSRRLIESLPFYYENSHSKRFVQFLGYAANVLFTMNELYCRVESFPNYGTKYTYDQMIEAGFGIWAHEMELPSLCSCVVGLASASNLIGTHPLSSLVSATLSNSDRTVGFTDAGEGQVFTKTTWDYTAGDRVGIEGKVRAYNENPSPGSGAYDQCELFLIGYNDSEVLTRHAIRYDQNLGLIYRAEEFSPTPATQQVVVNAAYVLNVNDVWSLSVNKSNNQVTIGVLKAGATIPVFYGPYSSIEIQDANHRSGLYGNVFNGAELELDLRTDASITDPCKLTTQTEEFKMVFPFSLNHRDWCGNRIGRYGEIADTVWYKTSFISLEYDDEKFFENVPQYVNLFEKITQLFYQLAPIQLVLESIIAKRTREHRFKLRADVWMSMHQKVETDASTVAGVDPGPPV